VSNQAPPMNSHLAVVLSRVRSNSRQPTVRAGAIIVRYLSLDSSTIWNDTTVLHVSCNVILNQVNLNGWFRDVSLVGSNFLSVMS
jgi:hypothetical protein